MCKKILTLISNLHIIFFSSFDSKFSGSSIEFFCSSESAKFEKNLQKVFTLSFELKETTPSWPILDLLRLRPSRPI